MRYCHSRQGEIRHRTALALGEERLVTERAALSNPLSAPRGDGPQGVGAVPMARLPGLAKPHQLPAWGRQGQHPQPPSIAPAECQMDSGGKRTQPALGFSFHSVSEPVSGAGVEERVEAHALHTVFGSPAALSRVA